MADRGRKAFPFSSPVIFEVLVLILSRLLASFAMRLTARSFTLIEFSLFERNLVTMLARIKHADQERAQQGVLH